MYAFYLLLTISFFSKTITISHIKPHRNGSVTFFALYEFRPISALSNILFAEIRNPKGVLYCVSLPFTKHLQPT